MDSIHLYKSIFSIKRPGNIYFYIDLKTLENIKAALPFGWTAL